MTSPAAPAPASAIFDQPLCVVDVETYHPGGKGERHRLVEIGAVVVDRQGYPGSIFETLCRPADLPRRLGSLLGNVVPVRELWSADVPSEEEAVEAFAEWHFSWGAPDLIAYNCPFDRGALGGALAAAQGWNRRLVDPTWPLPWGPCLMQTAKKVLGRQRPKEEAAAEALADPAGALAWVARRVGYRGPLDMHRALPDALLEAALLVALRRRQLAAAPPSPALLPSSPPASGRAGAVA